MKTIFKLLPSLATAAGLLALVLATFSLILGHQGFSLKLFQVCFAFFLSGALIYWFKK